jgi:anaerobic selenocysteine-containing dehydrogenase
MSWRDATCRLSSLTRYERALERFADPQSVIEMATYSLNGHRLDLLPVKAGGDAAALKGMAKHLLEMEAERGNVLDHTFIAEHTQGFDDFADIAQMRWDDIERESGLSQAALKKVAEAYAKSNATIITYGMGITQHNKGTANVRLIADVLLLRGNIGKPGAGICPLRGHSNVQGNRTVGISEKPTPAFLNRLKECLALSPFSPWA